MDLGDKDSRFCLQGCSKPISYLIACQDNGFDYVHNFVTLPQFTILLSISLTEVGHEPIGSFDEFELKDFPNKKFPNRKIPHNPFISAGAIMISSLIKR